MIFDDDNEGETRMRPLPQEREWTATAKPSVGFHGTMKRYWFVTTGLAAYLQLTVMPQLNSTVDCGVRDIRLIVYGLTNSPEAWLSPTRISALCTVLCS
jgi:hypothetical protein